MNIGTQQVIAPHAKKNSGSGYMVNQIIRKGNLQEPGLSSFPDNLTKYSFASKAKAKVKIIRNNKIPINFFISTLIKKFLNSSPESCK